MATAASPAGLAVPDLAGTSPPAIQPAMGGRYPQLLGGHLLAHSRETIS